MLNAIFELVHQVPGNLVRTCNITHTYVYGDYLWLVILAASAFSIHSITNRMKCYFLGQFIFGRDMIISIKHMVDWELIRQRKQMEINKDNIRKNRNQVDHNYNVGDKCIINNHAVHKYEMPYKVPFMIKRCYTNGTINLQDGQTKIRYNICRINPYKYDKNIEGINPKNIYDDVNIRSPVI